MSGPEKIRGYIALGWKGMPGTNTLAYWALYEKHVLLGSSQIYY
jgi:hypothetical protein